MYVCYFGSYAHKLEFRDNNLVHHEFLPPSVLRKAQHRAVRGSTSVGHRSQSTRPHGASGLLTATPLWESRRPDFPHGLEDQL